MHSHQSQSCLIPRGCLAQRCRRRCTQARSLSCLDAGHVKTCGGTRLAVYQTADSRQLADWRCSHCRHVQYVRCSRATSKMRDLQRIVGGIAGLVFLILFRPALMTWHVCPVNQVCLFVFGACLWCPACVSHLLQPGVWLHMHPGSAEPPPLYSVGPAGWGNEGLHGFA